MTVRMRRRHAAGLGGLLVLAVLGTCVWAEEDSGVGRRGRLREEIRRRLTERAAPEQPSESDDVGGLLGTVPPTVAGLQYADRAKNRVRNQLDLYLPPLASGQQRIDRRDPVLVWVHGGAWKFGDKSHVSLKPQAFRDKGYVLVAVNYRFVPEVTFREQAADIATAVAWVHTHIAEHGGDPERVYLMGHSAGAHLSALVATEAKYLTDAGADLSILKGVVLLDGAGYDVPAQMRFAIGPLRKLYEEAFGTREADWAEASPVLRARAAPKGTPFPPFLIHHVADRVDSRRQSHLLAEALIGNGGRAEVHSAEGKSHRTINREFGKAGDAVTEKTWAFLEQPSKK